MERGWGYISVHAVGQSRLGGVAADYATLGLISVWCCVVVVCPDNPFQEDITISQSQEAHHGEI